MTIRSYAPKFIGFSIRQEIPFL